MPANERTNDTFVVRYDMTSGDKKPGFVNWTVVVSPVSNSEQNEDIIIYEETVSADVKNQNVTSLTSGTQYKVTIQTHSGKFSSDINVTFIFTSK